MTQADRVLSTPPINTPILKGPQGAPGAILACPGVTDSNSRPDASLALASEGELQAVPPTCSRGWGIIQ
jgi:hypothetical protein